uniref:Uncharacterized protein n=1 Tax=Candidatus Kentrum sp. FW TaxID=2126338 RepID=A0A450TMB1_9GAMM|nr:MAG: hypothetical protein BECKFW1821C_GA0114237_101634 [Candidatus Kentron sp. FW]
MSEQRHYFVYLLTNWDGMMHVGEPVICQGAFMNTKTNWRMDSRRNTT